MLFPFFCAMKIRQQKALWVVLLAIFLVERAVNWGYQKWKLDWSNRHRYIAPYQLRHSTQATNCRPENAHLSPASNVDVTSQRINMTVSFTLPRGCEQNWDPLLYYGTIDNKNNFTATASESLEFSFSNYVQKFQSSRIYHTILPEINAGSYAYWYQIEIMPKASVVEDLVRRQRSPVKSQIFHFDSPPLPNQPLRVALIADWGASDEAVKTMQGMLGVGARRSLLGMSRGGEELPLSAVIVAGDISYANAHLPSWETFLNKMEPLFSSTPLLIAAGNHEIECNRHNFEVFQAYEHYFRVPNRIAAPVDRRPIPRQLSDCTHPAQFETVYNYGNSFYSYKSGMLHIIVLNSYTDTTRGSKQYIWLQEEFETHVDRITTPYVLVVFHCPLHTTFQGHNDEENPKIMMQDMEPLFVKHRVNFVLSGHNHAYVRSYPMIGANRSANDDGAPIYLTIGTGGESHSKSPLHPGQPEAWVAHRDNTEYGFGELTILNATHSYFRRVLNRGEAANPDAQDQVWIQNYNTVSSISTVIYS